MSSSLTFTLSPLALLAALFAISSFLARSVPKLLPLSAAAADRLSALVGPLKWAFDCSLRSSVLGHSPGHGEPGAFGVARGLGTARYGGATPAECAVCLCEVGVGEEVRELECCDHVFHRTCLDRWLSYKNATCPLCRRFVARRTSVSVVTEFGAEVISLAFCDLGSGGDREEWWLR
ncbi:E3 ubiquitin-protein ligase Os03g0188200-like [Rhodamnia argentea]|uniref:E3 ubiquitin-protein ligase Os03g0188200-like n=1 Tax=Rhodamnia argentea TaxID=178133 RepID=A0A8B8QIK2_9MYRT|nr:E3 ubiquitin-protein ligase Os03g0188200-like [Rhodamnia argentea]